MITSIDSFFQRRIDSSIIEIDNLSQFGLPAEFLNFLKSYTIEIDINLASFLNLSHQTKGSPLIDRIESYFQTGLELRWEEVPNFKREYISIGSFDGGEIVVKQGAHMHNESHVYMWEITSGHFEPIEKIANSFELLALTLANHDILRFNNKEDIRFNKYDQYESDCYRIVDQFNPDLSEAGRKLWRWLV